MIKDYNEAALAALIDRGGSTDFEQIHYFILMNVHDILHDWDFIPEYPTWRRNMQRTVSDLESQGFVTFEKQTKQWSITPTGRQHYDTLRARS